MISKMIKTYNGLILIVLFSISSTASAYETDNDEWKFMIDAYGWMPEIKAETAAGPTLDFPLYKIVQDLEFVFFGGIKAKKDRFKIFLDFIYLAMDDTEDGSFSIPIGKHHQIEVGTELDWELKAYIYQPMLSYAIFQSQDYQVDVAAGGRYLELELDLELETGSPLESRKVSTNEKAYFWDGVLAVKGEMKLSDQWEGLVYLDGGTGDSDYTWQAIAGLRYNFDNYQGLFGYRYLKWKFEDDSPLETLTSDGPYLGFRFTY